MLLSSFLIIFLYGILTFLIIRAVWAQSGLTIVHQQGRERCAAHPPGDAGNPDSLKRRRRMAG
jgi:hypothetical protein